MMTFQQLNTLTDPVPLTALDARALLELQRALGQLGFPIGPIDGRLGARTRTAWAEFKSDVHQGNPELVGPASIQTLQKQLELVGTGAGDFTTKAGTIAAIVAACQAQGLALKPQLAYVLATVQWETAQTFRPVREAFRLGEQWRREHLRYFPYYGRGYVQLTWERNYAAYAELLGIDLVAQPDLALEPASAAFILAHGFRVGSFTGRKLADYVNEHATDFVAARRCINGTDHAHEIAALAQAYLERGSW